MSAVLEFVGWLLSALVGLPLTVLVVEMAAGLLPSRRRVSCAKSASEPRIAVLIPAHDEQESIAGTVEAIRADAPAGTRILVVADNCSDATAQRAGEAGAEVTERHDPARRGKGFALAHGRDLMAADNPPDVLIVLDADCRVTPGSTAALAQAVCGVGRPVQAVNLVTPDLGAPPLVQISNFAMLVKNLYRSRGMQRLGGAALLTGTGMAFPWQRIANAALATASIVEDLALGIELTRSGHAPLLLENAGVRSPPAAMRDALQQRRRWERGFLGVFRGQAIPTLAGGLTRGSVAEILLGLHLLVPPLALLMLLSAVIAAILAAFVLLGMPIGPLAALMALVSLAGFLLFWAWMAKGRRYLSGATLARVPLYVLWKIPIYLGAIAGRRVEWTRTPRANSDSSDDQTAG